MPVRFLGRYVLPSRLFYVLVIYFSDTTGWFYARHPDPEEEVDSLVRDYFRFIYY